MPFDERQSPERDKASSKTKSPALVDSFSKSRGVFMFESGAYPDWGRPLLSNIGVGAAARPFFWLAARRPAASRLRNEPEHHLAFSRLREYRRRGQS
jgi:hypothetical protein